MFKDQFNNKFTYFENQFYITLQNLKINFIKLYLR